MSESGIYIHIPFCRQKCTYCDFYLVTNLNIIDKFVSNLLIEIDSYSELLKDHSFDSIFFGGGTPSVLSSEHITQIMQRLEQNLNISNDTEVTLEANPEDFKDDNSKLRKLSFAGINRISFGIQSFIDRELKFLTRLHSAETGANVINNAKEYFDNISIDLIYSVPGQKISDIEKSIRKAIELEVDHISAYTLIYEKETKLYKELTKNINCATPENIEREFYDYFTIRLIESGFSHYEISNYSKKGKESRHNKKYWEYNDYIGFGPSAHSKINSKRWSNFRNIIKYNISLQNSLLPVIREYKLSNIEISNEIIMLGLRAKGVDIVKYKNLSGFDFIEKYNNSVSELVLNGFAELNSNIFSLTEKGYSVSDEILSRYF